MTDRQTERGYRGALPPRNDRLAGPWVVVVIALFLFMVVLALVGLPSSLFPAATSAPSAVASASASPAGSGSDASAAASASPSASSSVPDATGSP